MVGVETDGLITEFNFYLENQAHMVEQYDGKFIVIKDCTVLGAFDTHLKAFTEMVQHHARGTFLIQQVSEGSEAYTATFTTPGVRPGE